MVVAAKPGLDIIQSCIILASHWVNDINLKMCLLSVHHSKHSNSLMPSF